MTDQTAGELTQILLSAEVKQEMAKTKPLILFYLIFSAADLVTQVATAFFTSKGMVDYSIDALFMAFTISVIVVTYQFFKFINRYLYTGSEETIVEAFNAQRYYFMLTSILFIVSTVAVIGYFIYMIAKHSGT